MTISELCWLVLFPFDKLLVLQALALHSKILFYPLLKNFSLADYVQQENFTFKVFWIDENYKTYHKKFLNKAPTSCFGQYSYRDPRDNFVKFCFNYSHGEHKQQVQNGYYIAILPANNVFYCETLKDLQHVMASWIDAWHTCGMEGGSLPLLMSRQEMHELIALLKLSPHTGDKFYTRKLMLHEIPQFQPSNFTPSPENIELIFIGLLQNKVRWTNHETDSLRLHGWQRGHNGHCSPMTVPDETAENWPVFQTHCRNSNSHWHLVDCFVFFTSFSLKDFKIGQILHMTRSVFLTLLCEQYSCNCNWL